MRIRNFWSVPPSLFKLRCKHGVERIRSCEQCARERERALAKLFPEKR